MSRSRLPMLVLAGALLCATPARSAPAAPAAGASATPRRAAAVTAAPPRRLEDVRIEGELEVPRVTFITVRQPHRFHDYTRATSVRSSRRLAAETTFPAWIPPIPSTSQDARKESRK